MFQRPLNRRLFNCRCRRWRRCGDASGRSRPRCRSRCRTSTARGVGFGGPCRGQLCRVPAARRRLQRWRRKRRGRRCGRRRQRRDRRHRDRCCYGLGHHGRRHRVPAARFGSFRGAELLRVGERLGPCLLPFQRVPPRGGGGAQRNGRATHALRPSKVIPANSPLPTTANSPYHRFFLLFLKKVQPSSPRRRTQETSRIPLFL